MQVGSTLPFVMADTNDSPPNVPSAFSSFGSRPAINNGMVAFYGMNNSLYHAAGIYTVPFAPRPQVPNLTKRIADTNTLVPGLAGVVFTGFGEEPSIAAGNVAFTGNFTKNSATQTGIFVSYAGTLYDEINTGDTLFNSTVTALSINTFSFSLDGTTLAFDYTLANGVSGVATFVIPSLIPTVTATRTGPGVYNFAFQTRTGVSYQLQSSPDLAAWTNVGQPATGDGTVQTLSDTSSAAKMFWRVVLTAN